MFKRTIIRRSLVAGLAIGAASLPAGAHAMLPLPDPVYSTGSQDSNAIALPAQSTGQTSQGGFQWGDAGIGAAGTVVLLGTGAVAAGAIRRRRGQRPAIG